ncbi:uncharacterized protein LOC110713568 [Chenopodium quinoa]|uniref:uncharacterized protein LOC110713568 n=1 Tax=Chenopodium quinoa TaxID=63459 RepID=UPI000B790884|nr:uncharacterized protein LOC110713568 [Chenopodium quinoa]
MEINALAVKLLHYGLGPHEHNRVMGCKNAKEIWYLLQVTHEGTNEVKRYKIDLLMSKYERCEMQSKETIQEMLTRFTNIINELVSLRKQIPIDEQVRKVLRSLPQDERWRAKEHAIVKGTKEKGLALKAGDQEESEVDEEEVAMLVRWFKRMFNRNNRTRNFTKKSSNSKDDSGCHKCGSLDHFIRECPLWETEKGKGKAKEQNKSNKTPYNKADIRKAMIASWGDSKSDDEEEQPKEEKANLCLMAKRDEKAYNDELAKEVCVDPNHLKTLPKEVLIDLILEMEDDWIIDIKKLNECEKALKVCKEHSTWIENQRTGVQGRFFDLFDKNLLLKEMNEKLKYENIMVNVELTQYKLASTDLKSSSSSSESLPKFNEDFEKLKHNLDELRIEKANLEKELAIRKERSTGQLRIPKWIENAQTKRTEGLGYIRSKHKGPSEGEQHVYLDTDCSKHMTGDKSKFLSLETYSGGTVTLETTRKEKLLQKENKDETSDEFVSFAKKEQKTSGNQIIHIRSDHGTEFENSRFDEFYKENGMDHNFSTPRTPQQNGVVERKNKTLEDMEQDSNDYEIGMVRNREDDEEETSHSKEKQIEPEQDLQENAEVPSPKIQEEQSHEETGKEEEPEEAEEEVPQIGVPAREFHPKPFKYQGSYPIDLIISDIGRGTQTRSQMRNFCAFQAF